MEDDPRAPGRIVGGTRRLDKRAHRQQQRPGGRPATPASSRVRNPAPPPPRGSALRRRGKRQQQQGNPRALCFEWSRRAECSLYAEGKCHFSHALQRTCTIEEAHRKGVISMCFSTQPPAAELLAKFKILPEATGVVQLFTAGVDAHLRQWLLVPDTTTVGGVRLRAHSARSWQLQSPALSLLYLGNEMVACGLKNSRIQLVDLGAAASSPPAPHTVLEGHRHEVSAMRLVENKLVSCDWDGRMIVWAPDPVNKSFTNVAVVELAARATCLLEVVHVDPASATRRWEVWVGSEGIIQIVNLAALHEPPRKLVVAEGKIDGDKRTSGKSPANNKNTLVMALEYLDGHVICAFMSLGVKVYRVADYTNVKTTNPKLELFTCCMEGSLSTRGPVLVCGSPHGKITILELPSLAEVAHSKISDACVRVVLNIGGQPSFFATATMAGNVEIWYWHEPPPAATTAQAAVAAAAAVV